MAAAFMLEIREKLAEALRQGIQRAKADGVFPPDCEETVKLETPKDRTHGHFATNAALVLARWAKKPPRQVAEMLLSYLPEVGF